MRSKNDSSFGNFHPISLFVYYISVIVLTMFTKNPIMLAFALFGSALFIIITNGAKDFFKSMRFYLPLFLIITVTNPLFSHNGKTILFFMNDNPVTLEAILYGADMALMICAVMFICRCMNFVMESDKLLCVFGTFSPKLSIVLSMSLRFIPLFKRKWKEIKDAQFSLGYFSEKSFYGKIVCYARVFSSLVTWALENAVITAKSMRARGFSLGGRKSFSMFSFKKRDAAMLSVCIILVFAVVSGYFTDSVDFYFYPEIAMSDISVMSYITYAAFGIISFFPFIFEAKEALKWKYSISKI